MANQPRRQLSLDTNVLLELADGGEVATDFRETFQARGYALGVTFDKHLLDKDQNPLRLLFDAADLSVVAIVHPGRLLRALL